MFIKLFDNKISADNYLEENPNFILASYNVYDKKYNYIVCSNKDAYYNLINKIVVNELIEQDKKTPQLKPFITHVNNIFEVIRTNEPKLFIDLDFRPIAKTTDEFNKLLLTLKTNLAKLLNIDLKSDLLESLIYVRHEEQANKILSSHIIFYKLKMLKEEQKNLMTRLKTFNALQKIDNAIYTKDRNFCMPNHTKFNYNNKRFFIPYNEYTQENNKIEYFLISNNTNTTLANFYIDETNKTIKKQIEANFNLINNIHTTHENFIELLIKHIPNEFYTCNAYIFNSLIKYLINNNYDVETFLNYSKTQEQKEYTTEQIEDYIDTIKTNNNYYNNILLYITKNYNIRFYIESKLTQQFINYVNTITKQDLTKELLLLDDKARAENYEWKKDKFILSYKNFNIHITEHTIKDKNKNTFYYEPQDKAENNSTYKNECNININNIEDLKNHIKTTKTKSKLIFVKALYGSGKTKQIINTKIEKLFNETPNKKVLFITENNTLNSELKTKLSITFKHLIIRHHQEFNEFNKKKKDGDFMDLFNSINIYICSLESINTRTSPLINYDLIILDEYSSILTHFKSPTMTKQTEEHGTNKTNGKRLIDNEYTKFKKFKSLLLQATEILALDADLTTENTQFLECLLNVKADKFYCNDNRFNDYTIYNYYNGDHLLNKFNEALSNNKKIALCSTSKRQLNAIYTAQKEKNKVILLLDRDGVRLYKNEYEEIISKEEFLKNIEHYITENQVELFLYSPTITTGVSIEIAYFNMLFAFCFNKYSPTARTFSQMLFRNRNLIDKEIYISRIIGLNYNHNINKNTIDEKYKLTKNYDKHFYNLHPTEKQDTDFKNLDILNEIEQKYSIVAYTQELLTLLKQHNLKVVNVVDGGNYFKDSAEIADAKIFNDSENLELLGKAYNITKATADEYLKKQETATITTDEKYELDRYFLIDTNDPIKTELINNLTSIEPNDINEILENKIKNLRGLTSIRQFFKRQKTYYYYDNESHTNFINEVITTDNKKKKYYDALTSKDREHNLNIIKHTILNILGLNRNNNFNVIYTNAEFEEHINNHKDTIINNFDSYISMLNFKPLYFSTTKKLTETIKRLINQFEIFEIIYKNKKYTSATLEKNPSYKYDKDTLINIRLQQNIYCFYNPYKHITSKDTIKILALENNNFKAISMIDNIYNETLFNKKDKLITTTTKRNITTEEAKQQNQPRKKLKEYDNKTLTEHTLTPYKPIATEQVIYKVKINFKKDENDKLKTITEIKQEPIYAKTYKLNIIFKKAENGQLKTFTEINKETIYNKQEQKTYYTTTTTKLNNVNNNVNNNNNNITKFINSIDGVYITRKTDINKIYQEKQPIYKYGFCNDKIRLNNNFDYEDTTTRIKYNIKFLTRIFNTIKKQTRYNRFNTLKNKIENIIYNIYHKELDELESDDEYI